MLQLRKQRSCAQNLSHAGNRICVLDFSAASFMGSLGRTPFWCSSISSSSKTQKPFIEKGQDWRYFMFFFFLNKPLENTETNNMIVPSLNTFQLLYFASACS